MDSEFTLVSSVSKTCRFFFLCSRCFKERMVLGCKSNQVFFVMFFSFIFVFPTILGFNMDIKTPVIQKGNAGDMFGYSVAQHIDQGQSWMLVGAPRAQTGQPEIVRGGAVLRCRIDPHNQTNTIPPWCQIIPFDNRGNERRPDITGIYQPIEDKNDQWFGATVISSGESGQILACAPRYVYLSTQFNKREPVGTCYLARSGSTTFEEYSPCRGNKFQDPDGISSVMLWGYHRVGFCQAGMSAVFSNNGSRLLIGAPGAFYWQGQVYNYWLDLNNNKLSTREEGASEDNKYRGYSSAVGHFDNDNVEDYVVGIPRAERLLGVVQLYNQNLQPIKNITGKQIGAYFGYALAVEDLNGDKLDDIIVGAPLHSDKDSFSYDTGRVYIYYQDSRRKFRQKKKDILDGYEARSRFGSALTGLGDINRDSFNDLAVGAPYGGLERRGVVYIYVGSMDGIITEVSQVLHGKDIGYYLTTFGFSISGGYDLDKNGYPDLVVGAYEADAAVFVKSRPIVRVAASLRLDPDIIKLEDKKKNCHIGEGSYKIPVPCLIVRTCVEYNGLGVSDQLGFDFFWTLDARKNISKRMFQYQTQQPVVSERNLTLTKMEVYCHDFIVYVLNNIRDKLTPIDVSFSYRLFGENEVSGRNKRQVVRKTIPPILDKYIPSTVTVEGKISKNCGKDELCIPDLSVLAERVEPFAPPIEVGSSNEEIEISITVRNSGTFAEDSYETMLYIELPNGMLYSGITNINAAVPLTCRHVPINETRFVICDIGNPMPARAKTYFTLLVTPNNTDGSTDKLAFKLNVNSSNPENSTDMWDNVYTMHIDVRQHAVLEISANLAASTEQIIYNATGVKLYKGTGFGPEIIHEYRVRNLGPTPVSSSLINIYWPSFDDQGNHLLKIDEEPIVLNHEGGFCQTQLLSPENSTDFTYREGNSRINVRLQTKSKRNSRTKRETSNVKNVVCNNQYCTFIKCFLGPMPGRMVDSREAAIIRIKSHIWTNTLILRGLTSEPFNLKSQALAQVQTMPYNIPVDQHNETYMVSLSEVSTYVNAERLAPRVKGVEIWKIAVAIVGGLLLLLIIIVVLWVCGFFKRKRAKDEPAYSKPLMKNGQQPKADPTTRPYE
ncbi:integrin alpha-8-like isoform X1 [Saccostrea echinata]|uniref:integrin alpha-8-like isoform X1 n=1 Tax=Saccostrea echinata TaxID=191078 RepID=UPI002A7EFA6D|nr:integrin alpha-8-like isoform X1 [Saccostrea echinata]